MTPYRSVYRPAKTLRLNTVVSYEAWEQEYHVGETVLRDGPGTLAHALFVFILGSTDEGWRLSSRAVKLRWAIEGMARDQLKRDLPGEDPDFEHIWDDEPRMGEGTLRTLAHVKARYDIVKENETPP